MSVRPLQPAPRRQRADAVRNRDAILTAAERLFAQFPPEEVSMDAIAAAAGVGKPTLYRSFGDRAGLVRALLETREMALQEAVLRGPPPLGPGAPPTERCAAFLAAYVDHIEAHLPVLLAADKARHGVRFDGLYEAYRHHVGMLARAARPDDPTFEPLIDALLAPLSPRLYAYQRRRGLTHAQIRQGVETLAHRLLGD
jgi:AcrR family transcriptional regulator